MTLLRGVWRALLTPATSAAVVEEESNFLDDLVSMDLAHFGQPFVAGPTKVTTDIQTMDYVFEGSPFVTYRRAS